MSETIGRLERVDRLTLAWRRVEGQGPTVVWLGGYRSDMTGTKAQALADWASAEGRNYLRFDYGGTGESEGAFEDGTITSWREDALAVIDQLTTGPVILIGSSMGAWIALLATLARPGRVERLILIAPATDFTSALVEPSMTASDRAALQNAGVWTDAAGQSYTRALIEDGRRWKLLPGPIPIRAPVAILQGGRDTSVPWRHALKLCRALTGPQIGFKVIKDGDHRLSRPSDIAWILAALNPRQASGDAAWRAEMQKSVYDFAKVSIQSLVGLSSAGFALAVTSADHLGFHRHPAILDVVLVCFGLSALLAVTCACFSYLNQAYIAFWTQNFVLARVARYAGGSSLACLLVAGGALIALVVGATAK